MDRRHLLAATPALVAAPLRAAEPATQPLVVELFTSQSCNSCPPADALLGELARDRADLLVLSYHVTYWNRLGWRDVFSLDEATWRQQRYAASIANSAYGLGQVYTPQIVVQGRRDAVGSDRRATLAAIAAESVRPATTLRVLDTEGAARIVVGEGSGSGSLLLVGYDARHVVAIRGGENGGRSLAYTNVVRGMVNAGSWQGRAVQVQATRPAGQRLAVLLQGRDGSIIAAARA